MPVNYRAYRMTTGGYVHRCCLRRIQNAWRKGDMRCASPGVEAALLPGHPDLPQQCRHCGKTIERGTEK